jgi:hypothetical protein
MRKLTVLVMATALLMLSLGQAHALLYNTLYAEDSVSNLYTIDSGTGAANLVGAIGAAQVTDINFANSGLWGITPNSTSQSLIKIDPDTGAQIAGGGAITGVATGGTLNALGTSLDGTTLYAAAYGTGEIGTLATNGTFTSIGFYGNGIVSSGDLAFDPNDATKLYAAVISSGTYYLATVDLGTGAATLIGSGIGFSQTFGISFKDGVMYAVTGTGDVFTVNTATGAASGIIGDNDKALWGMSTSPVPLPPSVWLFGSGLLGLMGLRRKFFR